MNQQEVEYMGMRLANRAYIYRIFRIVFGAVPSAEELDVLSSEETVGALSWIAAECHHPTLGEAAALCGQLRGGSVEDCVTELKAEFDRMFNVPGDHYVYAWESPYVKQEAVIFQENTLDVRRRFSDWGFEVDSSRGRYPEDHISLMAAFMAYAAGRTFDAFADGDDERAAHYLSSQQSFADAHLGEWTMAFAEKVVESDRTGFYATFALAAAAFFAVDRTWMHGVKLVP